MSYSETDTVKWRRILSSDMISSDSSGIENTVPVLVAKEIPWRSRKVSSFFEKLDKFYGTNHPQLKRPTRVTRTEQMQKHAWHDSTRVVCNTRVYY